MLETYMSCSKANMQLMLQCEFVCLLLSKSNRQLVSYPGLVLTLAHSGSKILPTAPSTIGERIVKNGERCEISSLDMIRFIM